jgi:phage protein D
VLFHGLIVRLKADATPDGRERATVTALDPSTKLHREAKTFHYTGGKVSEVIETIVVAHGLEVGKIVCEPDTELTPRAPLAQTNQTDLQFVQALARRYGARAFVEVNDGKPKFYFLPERTLLEAPIAGRISYCGGTGELISFEYRRAAGEAAPEKKATAVDSKDAKPATAASEPAPAAEPVSVDDSLLAGLAKRDPAQKAAYEAAVETAGKASEQPAEQVRKEAAIGLPSDPARAELAARRDLTRQFGMTGEGEAMGTIDLRAKSRVELSGIAPWAEGDWYVRHAKHSYRDTTLPGEARRSATYRTTFVATR